MKLNKKEISLIKEYIKKIQSKKINEAKKINSLSLANQLLTDVHAPAKYRINGVVENMPEFHKAFNIKPGSKMRRKVIGESDSAFVYYH